METGGAPGAPGAGRPLVMSDVAARAGVSHQTVSRVLNGHPHVAARTRERVRLAITELGYRPNGAARALVTGSTRTLGLVTVNISQYGPAQTLVGLEAAARLAGYSLSVAVLDEATAAALGEAVERFAASSVDALVLHTSDAATVAALGGLNSPVPLVAVQVAPDDAADHDALAVSVDHEGGARSAVRHLLDLGHRTVHHVAGPRTSTEARRRVRGWRAELRAAGSVAPPVVHGDWGPASGFAAGRRLVAHRAGGGEMTAVFVGNDQMALGVLNALHAAGLAVPDDVSVVGFDDVPEAAYYRPPLTTVRQDFAELGRRGVRLVLGRLRGETVRVDPVVPELVVRGTTGPAGAGGGS